MPMRPMRLRTVVFITLNHCFSLEGPALIFKAAVDEHQEQLVLTEGVAGVINRIIELGLITIPTTFKSDEHQHAYYREALSRVELEWDIAELSIGNPVRLVYRSPDDSVTALCDWQHPQRFEVTIERAWVLEPQTA